MNSYNTTPPLPQYKTMVNQVYEFYPDEKQLTYEKQLSSGNAGLKRIKSSKFNVPVSISKRNSIHRRGRRKRPLLQLSPLSRNPSLTSMSPYRDASDSESSFCSNSSNESDYDLESLPDLVADDADMTDMCSPISIREIRVPSSPEFFYLDKPKKLNFSQFQVQEPPKVNIFEIPEIVYKIIEFSSYQDDNRKPPIRRRPESFNHALLIHGDKQIAQESLIQTNNSRSQVLYNCFLVNKLFNQVTREVLSKRFYFDDETKMVQYLNNNQTNNVQIRPSEFKLNKLYQLKSLDEYLCQFNFENLNSIEIFMCPKFLPGPEFFVNSANIKHLVICGSKILDDDYLMYISNMCPNLETLDFRGCEMITDAGIYHIATHCSKLTSINFGRKNRGYLITDASIGKLVENNVNLSTIGLAGCHVTDKSVWALSVHCNHNVQRLSLNNCPLLTNQCLPLILMTDYLDNLNVLEIKYTNITNLKSIIEFKRKQEFKGIPILIEVCEQLCYKMRQQEVEMDKIISERIFQDIQDWANDDNDGDSCYRSLLSSRG